MTRRPTQHSPPRMSLLTQELRRRLPPLGAMDDKDPAEVPIVVKFFYPAGSATWYVTEFDPETETFFGFAELLPGCGELGYFSLAELEEVGRGRALGVEHDLHIGKHMLREVLDGARP